MIITARTTSIYLFIVSLILVFTSCATKEVTKIEKIDKEQLFLSVSLEQKLNDVKTAVKDRALNLFIPPKTKIDTVVVDSANFKIIFHFNSSFLGQPIRSEYIKSLKSDIHNVLGKEYADYSIELIAENKPLDYYIPNFYRYSDLGIDKSRLPLKANERVPLVSYLDKKTVPTKGLINRNIVLWNSHGWYYSHGSGRWEWQRPRLFQTVEDLLPTSFVLHYLLPMLENAGAYVFLPRERDIQINEVVLDDDEETNFKEKYIIHKSNSLGNAWKKEVSLGFKLGKLPYADNYNPFYSGAHHYTTSELTETAAFEWIPDIPESGNYAVYISYVPSENNADDALYTIHHSGGYTSIKVNQLIGGKTWTYIGFYNFNEGYNPAFSKITLSNKSNQKGKIISADAVRFGGGMGVISRNGNVSGRPKYLEGARYYLQYTGAIDSLVYSLNNNSNDYADDYQSRAEYANFLNGAPNGPNKDRNSKGLQIPIDLSFSFHTDAGVTKNDTVIGTLAIYSTTDKDSSDLFPNGLSRFSNRDFADIVQTQLVDDIRFHFDPTWSRRDLRKAQYSESFRPNMTGMLLELLSHQNFLDMQFALDPRFQFVASRAIYKGMLKHLSAQNGFDYVVTPLPVTHFSAEITGKGNILLKWKPQIDSLEQTATPKEYIVYTRKNNGGFDNGTLSSFQHFEFSNPDKNVLYSFKVSAVNDGGESFPSEILSVHISEKKQKPFLIVNGFDRVCAAKGVNDSSFSGFVNSIDAGVPYLYDLGFTGNQIDYAPDSKFITNDMPGHGASKADYETKIIAGNTFDFPFVHGNSLKELGYSFVSSSDEAIEYGLVNLSDYPFIDFILGEEKSTPWIRNEFNAAKGIQFKTYSTQMQKRISDYLLGGGNLFVSGAYIASDLANNADDSSGILFMNKTLKYKLGAIAASGTGKVDVAAKAFMDFNKTILFNTELNDKIYQVEAPESILPANGSKTLLRYADNNFSAAIGYKKEYGIVAMGFPFETITQQSMRNELMKAIIAFLKP